MRIGQCIHMCFTGDGSRKQQTLRRARLLSAFRAPKGQEHNMNKHTLQSSTPTSMLQTAHYSDNVGILKLGAIGWNGKQLIGKQ
jgi:hypothetical protein